MDIQIRDRIIEFRRIKACDLQDNDGNWRTHPDAQKDGLGGLLRSVGIVGVLLAYYSERNDGDLTLIDGHLRKSVDPEIEWPVAITDLNDDEADLVLATYDPLSAMAGADADKQIELLDRVKSDELAVREILRTLGDAAHRMASESNGAEEGETRPGPQRMDLLPFEHYDYVLLMFKNELDWVAAIETLGLERRADIRKTNKVGLCRVIDGSRVIEMIRQLREQRGGQSQ